MTSVTAVYICVRKATWRHFLEKSFAFALLSLPKFSTPVAVVSE